MATNRISQYLTALPEGDVPQVPPGFMAVPLTNFSAKTQQAIRNHATTYQAAYDRARAEAELSFMKHWFMNE